MPAERPNVEISVPKVYLNSPVDGIFSRNPVPQKSGNFAADFELRSNRIFHPVKLRYFWMIFGRGPKKPLDFASVGAL